MEFLTIQHRYQNACHTSISVDNNVAGQFNEEPNGDDSNLEQNEFEITDIQEEQGPSVLGSNRTEIAEFSQEKLLEIINFIKVGYYVGDYNLNNKKFSELEERSYRVPAKFKEEGYKIIQFYNMRDNEQQYRHAGYVFIKDKEITIVYLGSRNWFDYMKDAEMILTSSDELLPEGGKIHSGFYSLFKDSWESVYKILKGYDDISYIQSNSGIASSINSNHYLNENNIGLKQLCAIENIPIKGVSDSTGAENRFPGSKNIISDSAIDDEKKQARNVPEKKCR